MDYFPRLLTHLRWRFQIYFAPALLAAVIYPLLVISSSPHPYQLFLRLLRLYPRYFAFPAPISPTFVTSNPSAVLQWNAGLPDARYMALLYPRHSFALFISHQVCLFILPSTIYTGVGPYQNVAPLIDLFRITWLHLFIGFFCRHVCLRQSYRSFLLHCLQPLCPAYHALSLFYLDLVELSTKLSSASSLLFRLEYRGRRKNLIKFNIPLTSKWIK